MYTANLLLYIYLSEKILGPIKEIRNLIIWIYKIMSIWLNDEMEIRSGIQNLFHL